MSDKKLTDWIKLNVGGTMFETTRSTLMAEPNSLLAKMFAPDSDLPAASDTEDGVYRIDASPRAFGVILNWLRYKKLLLEDCSVEEVAAAADFFRLEDLIVELQPTYLLMSTKGPAAEHQSNLCGVWRKEGVHNSRPYYKLYDTNYWAAFAAKNTEEHRWTEKFWNFLYSVGDAGWVVSKNLGKTDGDEQLMNPDNTDHVPVIGWQYKIKPKNDANDFFDDPLLQVTPVPDLATIACSSITITSSRPARANSAYSAYRSIAYNNAIGFSDHHNDWEECVGTFLPTEEFSYGRQIFRNSSGKTLSAGLWWSVSDSDFNSILWSGCAPGLCPANPRAGFKEKLKFKSWIFYPFDDDDISAMKELASIPEFKGWKDDNIVVKCSTHS